MKKHVVGSLLVLPAATIALADNPAAIIQVDAGRDRHAISPLIHGANSEDKAAVRDLNLPLASTYNWQVNATSRAGVTGASAHPHRFYRIVVTR